MVDMIEVGMNISAAVAALQDIKIRHIPFAVATALTETANQASTIARGQLKKIFVLRNTWTEGGMQYRAAKWRDSVPTAHALAVPWYDSIQEDGGEKIAHNGNKYVAIPFKQNMGIPNSSIVPTHLRPRNLLSATKSHGPAQGFILTAKDGRKYIFIRFRSSGRYSGIKPLYELVLEAKVKAVLHFHDTVKEVAETMAAKNFEEALQLELLNAHH
jgi:hypothetical protein